MQRRLFIAINLPEALRGELVEFQKKYSFLNCRWARQENLHLTLVFLGYVRDDKVVELENVVAKASKKVAPFNISLTRICYGPGKKFPPRLVWVEGEESENLVKLKEEIESMLDTFNKVIT